MTFGTGTEEWAWPAGAGAGGARGGSVARAAFGPQPRFVHPDLLAEPRAALPEDSGERDGFSLPLWPGRGSLCGISGGPALSQRLGEDPGEPAHSDPPPRQRPRYVLLGDGPLVPCSTSASCFSQSHSLCYPQRISVPLHLHMPKGAYLLSLLVVPHSHPRVSDSCEPPKHLGRGDSR